MDVPPKDEARVSTAPEAGASGAALPGEASGSRARALGRISAHPLPSILIMALASVAVAALAVALVPGPSSSLMAPARASTRVDTGQVWGAVFRGRAPGYESMSRAEADANAVPAGASVDRAADTVRLAGKQPQITIVANPPNGANMAFRAAGLENPTIEVRQAAYVTVRFVNGDRDSAHGWLLLDPVVQVRRTFHGPRAFAGSYAPILGDPGPSGQPVETIHFQATVSGTYRYECPVPGHAAMGMQGQLVVS